MRGALKVTYIDGAVEYFEVDPVGGTSDFADNLKAFLANPHITLILAVLQSAFLPALAAAAPINKPSVEAFSEGYYSGTGGISMKGWLAKASEMASMTRRPFLRAVEM